MHRTQLLLPADLHRRAAATARARRLSLGSLLRDALTDYLARAGDAHPTDEAIDDILLSAPYEEPAGDPMLSVDVDHHLYGAPRRSRRRVRR